MKSTTLAVLSLFLSLGGAAFAAPSESNRAPDVPSTLQVPAGCKVSFRAFAMGVQIYTATPSATDPTKLVWTFTAPEAVLMDSDGAIVGTHYAYAGPTRPAWETESGSLVVAARNVPPVTVDPTAIPWLLLETVFTDGAGILQRTAYIQRVNTTGGLAPSEPPMKAGDEAHVAYTAEYVFYRATE